MDPTVEAWFEQTKNPKVDVMLAVRNIIMDDPDITETVKYRAPAFEYDGIMCYFNTSVILMRSKPRPKLSETSSVPTSPLVEMAERGR